MTPSHYDLLVVVVVGFGIQVAGLTIIAWLGWDSHRRSMATLAEIQRLTRAVGALVVQESDKIRALFPERRG